LDNVDDKTLDSQGVPHSEYPECTNPDCNEIGRVERNFLKKIMKTL